MNQHFYYMGFLYLINCLVYFLFLDKTAADTIQFFSKIRSFFISATKNKNGNVFKDIPKMQNGGSKPILEFLAFVAFIWVIAGIFYYDTFIFIALLITSVISTCMGFLPHNHLKKVLVGINVIEISLVTYLLYIHLII